MSKGYDLELDYDAIGEIVLRSEETAKMLEDYGSRVADAANGMGHGNYEMETQDGKKRKRVSVYPADKASFFRNLNSDTLTKALWSVKDD